MNDSGSGYQLTSGEDELGRLELQDAALAPSTRMIFATAGFRPGMRVQHIPRHSGKDRRVPTGNRTRQIHV